MSKISIHLYNDDTIDGKSRNIAYTLWGSKLVADKDVLSGRTSAQLSEDCRADARQHFRRDCR